MIIGGSGSRISSLPLVSDHFDRCVTLLRTRCFFNLLYQLSILSFSMKSCKTFKIANLQNMGKIDQAKRSISMKPNFMSPRVQNRPFPSASVRRWQWSMGYNHRSIFPFKLNQQSLFLFSVSSQLTVLFSKASSDNLDQKSEVLGTEAVQIMVPTADDMEEIGFFLSSMVFFTPESPLRRGKEPPGGLVIFLKGDLGAGKTVFARGFVRSATGNMNQLVSSPTYLLSNTYEINVEAHYPPGHKLHHMDLYRLDTDRPNDFVALNLERVFRESVALVEWPIRLPVHLIPNDRLDITFTIRQPHRSGSLKIDEYEIEQRSERILSLTPRGSHWEKWIQLLVSEGYLDDIIV